MKFKHFFLPALMALTATAASAHTVVQLTPANISQQVVSIAITKEGSPQGQHFIVAVDTKGQPMKFLGSYMNLFDGNVPVSQSHIEGSQDTDGKTYYGFFVNKRFFGESMFDIPLFNTQTKEQYDYQFRLQDFAPAPQTIVQPKINPKLRTRVTVTQNGQPYAMLELPSGLAQIQFETGSPAQFNDQSKTMLIKGSALIRVTQGDKPAFSMSVKNAVVKIEQLATR